MKNQKHYLAVSFQNSATKSAQMIESAEVSEIAPGVVLLMVFFKTKHVSLFATEHSWHGNTETDRFVFAEFSNPSHTWANNSDAANESWVEFKHPASLRKLLCQSGGRYDWMAVFVDESVSEKIGNSKNQLAYCGVPSRIFGSRTG